MTTASSRLRRPLLTTLVTTAVLTGMLIAAPAANAAPIGSAGPLTRVEISPDLNCAVDHTGDADPEFFGDTACGTLLAAGGTLFGPASIPAGGSASPRTAFTPVSQSAVTGTGTGADPFTVVTIVSLGTSGLRITETDRYVTGEESYRTDVTVSNLNDLQTTAVLYRAGDCFLQNSDFGFGSADPATGSVSCVAGVDDGNGNTVPGTRIEQWFPLSAGSHYLENSFGNVWAAIGTQLPFTDSCGQCTSYIDNGAGLSWDLTIPGGGSVTRSHLTVFSPLGRVPLSTTKTADSDPAGPGGTDGYTITIHNPNTVAVSLDSMTDTLPSGFSYQAGSTTGSTTSDPSISSQDLSWSGPISVPASGDASIHFNVTVASTPGDYFNNAGGSAEGFTVAPTGDTAKITVTGVTGVPGAPTNIAGDPGNGSAAVTWTAPASDGGSAIDGYTVTCTATANANDVHSATVDATTTSAQVAGLTNGVEYACVVTAHNVNGNSDPSAPSDPFTPTGSGAQFSMTIDTSVGGILLINPEGPANLGTTGKIKIPPQFGPATEVVVTASLFGIPGETDATCGGNVCIGQGIEWSVSNPSAIKKMRVKFIEAKTLTNGGSAQDAVAYKDGVAVPNCVAGVSDKNQVKPCVVWRYTSPGGLWQVTLLVDGSDPKGRI
ncbi:MAG: fibronectin type III domain-containing protein [Actinomycetota bacterium]